MKSDFLSHPASFRDPDGRILVEGQQIFREIRSSGIIGYNKLKKSGLYKALTEKNMLIKHIEIESTSDRILIQPDFLNHISYPYEWSFSQLKDAALLTLDIQQEALNHGMSLKDASAYNIQFINGSPVFIDTSSFEVYVEGTPWVAYKQFCQHFLAPLALMAKSDLRLGLLLRNHIDGIPLDLAKKLLPFFTRFNFHLFLHIYLHSSLQGKYSASGVSQPKIRELTKTSLFGIIDSLKTCVRKLSLLRENTEWGDYYNNTNYEQTSFSAKVALVQKMGMSVSPKCVWDLGANKGVFSRVFSKMNVMTISWDIDPVAVEKNYLEVKKNKESFLYPQVLDLTNPSPSLGWDCKERQGFFERSGSCDLVLALALIHHLSISNNVPFTKVAEAFSRVGKFLLIEFVPKSDSQVEVLLSSRKDIFSEYDFENFEKSFSQYYDILEASDVPGTKRKLYLMKKK